PLEIMGFSKAEQKERISRTLELVDLEGFEKKFPWQLSGGMQQRASIARALAFDADLLLMDEPFGALDEMTRERMNIKLRRIWQQTQSAVIFVTHSIAEAVYLSNRVAVMSARPGRIMRIIDIDLPQQRNNGTRNDPRFFELVIAGRDALREAEGTAVK
ncbi:MAG TPA: ABC transporter ATP-binding protein, partial [Anaerolineae bacterium]|nr:ABC transporter ATP-binding protein [Anaerolineae bacterium]